MNFKFIEIISKKNLTTKQLFFYSCLIYLLALSSVFRADFNYIDDLDRVVNGVAGWDNWSRYTSNFLSQFLHTSPFLSDISPLSQLIAVVCLCLTGCILARLLTGELRFNLLMALAIVPLGLSPYFLECLSYKYDSPYMALSVLMGVLPFIWIENKVKYIVITIVSCLVICTTYQVSISVWLISLFFILFNRWTANRQSYTSVLKEFLVSVVSFLIGLCVFKVFIMNPASGYVSNHVTIDATLVKHIMFSLKTYLELAYADFNFSWLSLSILIVICSGFVLLKKVKKPVYISGVTVSFLMTVTFFCSFGLYPVLDKPLYAPRAMYGLGVFLCICCIYICGQEKNILGKVSVLSLSWCFIVFSVIYGNALASQKTYTLFRTFLIYSDLKDIQTQSGIKISQIRFIGNIGFSPVIRKSMETHQMLTRLVPSTLGDGWLWAYYGFLYHYGLTGVTYNQSLSSEGMTLGKKTLNHTIYTNDGKYVIELH